MKNQESTCLCLTFSAAMLCLDSKISLVDPKHQLMVPSTLLAPATHIQTDKATKPQRYIRSLHAMSNVFQNSSKRCHASVLLPLRTYSVPAMYPRVFEAWFLVSLSFRKEFVLYVVCSSWESRVRVVCRGCGIRCREWEKMSEIQGTVRGNWVKDW